LSGAGLNRASSRVRGENRQRLISAESSEAYISSAVHVQDLLRLPSCRRALGPDNPCDAPITTMIFFPSDIRCLRHWLFGISPVAALSPAKWRTPIR